MKKYISNSQMKSLSNIIRSAVFSILWGIVKYLPAPWFNLFRFFVLKMFCKSIKSMYIGENVTIWFPWNISIGKNVSINNGCTLDGTGGIVIGDDTRIAGNVGLHTADHGFGGGQLVREAGFVIAPIMIGKNVWVGYGTNVVRDIVIADNSVIGCGSVVTKNVLEGSVVAGNPAKVIK